MSQESPAPSSCFTAFLFSDRGEHQADTLGSVLVAYSTLPGFWKFMYRVSPFTYLVEGILSLAVADTNVVCSAREFLHFDPPSGQTCGQYLDPYLAISGGTVLDRNATSDCSVCSIGSTNTFLASFSINYANRYRDFGIMWAYIIFNVFAAIGLYWLVRVVSGRSTVDWPS